ncbi:hypothetical protein [Streptomyces sp. Wb2n-11]|uniref:hypothetical protein n=1 Tax=Streptomyces sp. Wb2n-11 TaxID=1030533 RepID=UPI00114643D8|nr:hypothetical protein [Streptomyces sp. Wb2n-11]
MIEFLPAMRGKPIGLVIEWNAILTLRHPSALLQRLNYQQIRESTDALDGNQWKIERATTGTEEGARDGHGHGHATRIASLSGT